ALGGIGAHERGPRFDELVLLKKREAVRKRAIVDAIGADAGGQAAGQLRDVLRLARVRPDDDAPVEQHRGEAEPTDESLAHRPIVPAPPALQGVTSESRARNVATPVGTGARKIPRRSS